jgi:hypothetical protein
VKKSIAAIASLWLRRKASQRLAGSGSRGARFIQQGDGSFRDIENEHEKFAMDARRSPGGILDNHPEHQLPHLLRSLSSPNLLPDFRDHPPIHAKTGPVPPDYGFRCDHDERLFPSRPEPTHGNPKELIEDAEAWPRASPLQHGELLAKNQVLQDQTPLAAKEANEDSELEQKHVEHEQSYNRKLAAERPLCY